MIAVVVTTHQAYLHRLPDVLRSIEAAGQIISQRVLVLDSVSDEIQAPGWDVVRVQSGNPNPARNAGLARVKRQWVMFWDGDNIMPSYYPAVMAEQSRQLQPCVAVLYPDIQYADAEGNLLRTWRADDWDYWTMRERTYIDTSSLWRVEALHEVGGFRHDQPMLDDWDLALRLTHCGWTCQHAHAETSITEHPDRRSGQRQNLNAALWKSWDLAIVTLWSGSSPSYREVGQWLAGADLPECTTLYWTDNSDSPAMGLYLRNLGGRLLDSGRAKAIHHVNAYGPYVTAPGEEYLHPGRHRHVAGLYNRLIGAVRESLVLFLEDDTVPPLDGLRKLHQELSVNNNLAGVGGVYEARNLPGHACLSLYPAAWNAPRLEHVTNSVFPCGMIGGGFTLYRMAAVRKCLPFTVSVRQDEMLGWDATLGRNLHHHGYRLAAHGGVRADHKF